MDTVTRHGLPEWALEREQGLLEDVVITMSADPLRTFGGETVLITGDTGFKGSWLAIWLAKLNAKVIGYGLPPKYAEDNYCACGLDERYSHIDGDIRDLPSLEKLVSEVRPSMIFHLAAQALVLDSLADPLYTFETNVLGTVNVLEATRRSRSIRAVVNVTSDKCYENQEWPYGYRETDRLGERTPIARPRVPRSWCPLPTPEPFLTGPMGRPSPRSVPAMSSAGATGLPTASCPIASGPSGRGRPSS